MNGGTNDVAYTTKISESRPIRRDGVTVGWEEWVFYHEWGKPKVGHVVGSYERTGDFDTDYNLALDVIANHEANCDECQNWKENCERRDR